MFYGIRARGPKDPHIDDVIESVRPQLDRWKTKDLRKEEIKKERKVRSAKYASSLVAPKKEQVKGPAKTIAAARKFHLHCKAYDKEKLWDKLLNRPPKKRRAKPVKVVPVVEEPEVQYFTIVLPRCPRGTSRRR